MSYPILFIDRSSASRVLTNHIVLSDSLGCRGAAGRRFQRGVPRAATGRPHWSIQGPARSLGFDFVLNFIPSLPLFCIHLHKPVCFLLEFHPSDSLSCLSIA